MLECFICVQSSMQIIIYILLVILISRAIFSKKFFYSVLLYNSSITLVCAVIITSSALFSDFFIFDIGIIYVLVGFISTIALLKYHETIKEKLRLGIAQSN